MFKFKMKFSVFSILLLIVLVVLVLGDSNKGAEKQRAHVKPESMKADPGPVTLVEPKGKGHCDQKHSKKTGQRGIASVNNVGYMVRDPFPLEENTERKLSNICPKEILQSFKGPEGQCCDEDAADSLQQMVDFVRSFGFEKCPACDHAVVSWFCTTVCSHKQSLLYEVVATKPAPASADPIKRIVDKVHFFFGLEEMWDRTWSHCKDNK